MKRMQPVKRFFALILAMIAFVSFMPATALAEGTERTTTLITAFGELEEQIRQQSVPYGKEISELSLPESLTAVTSADETISVAGVTWVSSPVYDGEKAGSYTFLAALPEGYTLAEGVNLPEISVTVEEDGNAAPFLTLTGSIASVTTAEELIAVFQNGGSAVLASSITLSAPLVVASGKSITLDLNGKTIDRAMTNETASPSGNVITVNGELIIEDSQGTGIITGGIRSGYTGGGGIYVNGGTVTMTGGTVGGNTTTGDGGGVYVKNGAFTMAGGTIGGNASAKGGGGVCVSTGGTFTMNAGTISGNTTTGNGGGVYADEGAFIMNGGTVSGNTAAGNETGKGFGGGVSVMYGGSFSMYDGVISNNTAEGYSTTFGEGGGVFINMSGSFTMGGGRISGNEAYYGGGVFLDGSEYNSGSVSSFAMSAGEISENTTDSSSESGYGGGVYVASGAFSISGGKIIRNSADIGGGVYMLGGTSSMENSEINENKTFETSLMSQGGGVFVANGAFTMKSGKINLNKAARGGGVYALCGTFTMESGQINENSTYALEDQLCDGGGVYVNTGSTFDMNGGEICGNTTSPWNMYNHGGVYVYGGTFKVSGGAKILNNSRGGVPNNVYLRTNGEIIQIEGQLTGADSSIGISTGVAEAAPLTVAQGSGYTVSEGDKMKFTRDKGGELTLADNKITLPDPDKSYLIFLSYNANGGSGSQLSSAILEGMPNSITVASGESLTRDNCSFAGWNTAADGSGTSYPAGSPFTLTANTVLYAQWTINRTELTVAAPQGGVEPSNSATCSPSGVTASLTWKQGANSVDGNFDYNMVYSVETTLTAGSGCKFAGSPEATVNGQSAGSVQRTSDTGLVVSYTFAKTNPRGAPTANISQSVINVANTGGTTPVTLNVEGIIDGYNSLTWTMSKTDSSNIVTLPSTTIGTLTNGALSLGSIVVLPNAAGQPAKSASVTITFSGNEEGEYAGLPASITVSIQLAAGSAPDANMDFIGERITGVSSEMEYIINDSAGTPVDWTGATTVTGTEITISNSIPSGSASKYIHIRYKGISGTEPKSIEIPARPDLTEELDWDSWVVNNIENDVELGYVPADFGYRINNDADEINIGGWDLAIPLAPGNTLTFWMPASSTNFKSAEITVTAPARLPDTNVVIDFAAESLNTTEAMQYRLSEEDDWTSCTANMTAADFGWGGTAAVSVQLRYPNTDDNYASQTQSLTIPARPAAPAIGYTATATKVTVAAETGVRYRLDGGLWMTANSDGKVIFTGLTANESYTLYAERLATSSAFGNFASSGVSTGSPADGTGSVSMGSWTYGGTAAEPVPVSATNGTSSVSYTYSGTKADGTAYSSSAKPADAGSYTVTATFAAAGDYKQVVSEASSFTIAKKELEVQWKNLTAVYDGAPKSPAFTLIGVESGDKSDVSAQLSESRTNAGSYAVTAALSGSRAFNYILTNPRGTLVIQKAPVIFSITADSVQYDGSAHTAAVTAAASGSVFSAYSVTYKDSDGNAVTSPSDEGSYDIYAQITDANYRHADATDGTDKKIGVLTIYAASSPDIYTVSFSGGAGAVGSVTTLTAAQAGTIRILPDSTGMTNGTKPFAGWKYDGKTYQPGEGLPQPASDILLTAIWMESTYSLSGVVYQGGNSLPDAVVTLMRGSVQIGQTVTGTDGEYSFANAAPGCYNVVACKNGITQTALVEISQNSATNKNIILPAGKTNSVVEVAAGSPAIIVGNLEQTFSNADQQAAGNGSTVEMKLNARALMSFGADQAAIEATASETVGLYLELNLTRTVIPASGAPSTTAVTESSVLLEIVVQIPGELQGKDSYVVYRRHNGEVQTLTATPNGNGEYIRVNADKTAIVIHAKLFSTYAVGYIAPTNPENIGNGSSSADFTITATAGDGGSISPSGSVGMTRGESKTFTVTADKGYAISNVLADGVSLGAVSSYTFSNIAASHTIKAIFTEAAGLPYCLDADGNKAFIGFAEDKSGEMKYIAPEGKAVLFTPNPKSFTDISDHWGKAYIDFVTERELFLGTGNAAFSPDAGMSRAMFATIIGRLYEHSYGKIEVSGSNTFKDCDYGSYYGKYVDWTAKEGIIEGYGNDRFGPDDPITRQQIAVMLYRFSDYLGVLPGDVDTWLNYRDAASISSWAERAALYCQTTGIISGQGSGLFAPQETATRAEVATMIERFIEFVMA